MEDLAASLMSTHPHSAPLYLLYGVSGLTKHGLAPPVHYDDDGFEFATAAENGEGGGGGGGGYAALRACASDVSAAAAFGHEPFPAGAVLLPLRLPPRLQRPPPARSAGASAAASPTFGGTRQHCRGFDPFAAALEKVRRDAAPSRRSRSLSPLRGSGSVSSAHNNKDDGVPRRPTAAAQKARRPAVIWPAKKSVKRLLSSWAIVASAAVAPRALRPRKKGGTAYRPGRLLVCFGF